MERQKMHSPDLVTENIEKIAALFPQCVVECFGEDGKTLTRKVDWETLQQELSGSLIDGTVERYRLEWAGRREAILLANSPVAKTLRPCREESVDFDRTKNLYIEGDNLDVLKLLRDNYLGKVKMIYIDPPYNTGNDFIYEDDFAQDTASYLRDSNQVDDQGNRLTANPETSGRYHSDWLTMMYPRLRLARQLLREDGVIFISIDDNEVHNLRKICDEIFGEENFVDCITWNTRVPKNDNKGLGNIHQYVLVYVKQAQFDRQFMMMKDGLDDVFELCEKLKRQGTPIAEAEEELKKLYNKKGYDRGITLYNALDDNYQPFGKINMSWPNSDTFGPTYDVLHPLTKNPTKKPARGWRWNRETFDYHLDYDNVIHRHDGSFICGDIWFAEDENTQPSSIKYLRDVGKMLLRTIVSLKSDGSVELESIFEGMSYFSNPKPTSLLRLMIGSLEETDGLILDFFSGSATTAHAVMQLNAEDGGNRQFIMVQVPEVTDEKSEAYKVGYKTICEIGKERIRRAGAKIKAEWEQKQAEMADDLLNNSIPADLDIGFRVLKLDSSNMNDVYYRAEEVTQESLGLQVDNIKDDRTAEDLLFQAMLDNGLELTLPITSEKLNGKTVYFVNGDAMAACFELDIDNDTIKAIAHRNVERVIFRENGFASDAAKINTYEIFKQFAKGGNPGTRHQTKITVI